MKIAFITYEFPPFIYGGAGVYAKNIAEHLALRGHKVHVFVPSFAGKKYKFKNIVIHKMPSLDFPIVRIPLYWLSLFFKFKREEQKASGFDIIIGNAFSELPVIKRFSKTKRIVVIHQSMRQIIEILKPTNFERIANLDNELGLAYIFDDLIIKRADRIIVVSNFTKNSLLNRYDLSSEKIEVVYNGFDDCLYEFNIEEREQLTKELDIKNEKIILFVGRINDKRKGLNDLLTAFKSVLSEVESILVVAGSGDSSQKNIMCEKLGINKEVRFVGKVDDVLLKKLYSLCDVCVSPSYYESFGLTLCEAMSAKKPVIVRNMGVTGEVVTKDNGFLFENQDEMANAIVQVLQNENKYKEVGRKNRDYVLKKFSWGKSAEEIEKVANELIGVKK